MNFINLYQCSHHVLVVLMNTEADVPQGQIVPHYVPQVVILLRFLSHTKDNIQKYVQAQSVPMTLNYNK